MTPRELIAIVYCDLWPGTQKELAKRIRVPTRRLSSWVLSDGRHGAPTDDEALRAVLVARDELESRLNKARALVDDRSTRRVRSRTTTRNPTSRA